ncbi:MAG: MerR family transcriptional regulator [Desulfobacterales bacterium]|nr:MerR family transcriptional regulator [Desulfobacterales bacterium]
MARLLTISEAARELGCSVEWLRAAELSGKIPIARRDINSWRRYSPDDVKEIKRLLFPTRK